MTSGPSIDGVISDETPDNDGDDRALLPGRCMTFDGTNQDWYSGSIGEIFASTNQDITAFIDVKFESALSATEVFLDALEGTEGFRIYQFNTTTLRVQWYNSSGSLQTKTFATTSTFPDLNDQKWMRLGFRFDSASSKVSCIINGNVITEYASQSFNTLDLNNIFVGSSNGNSDFCNCSVAEVAIYKASLSNAELRDEYLNRYSTNPNYLWSFKNKSNVFDQVGTLHGSLDNVGASGILTTSADVPVRKWDFNEGGYTNNSGTIVPRRIGTALDAQGNSLQYTGTPPRNAALVGAGCIDLNGTNQYGALGTTIRGLIKETASFSFRIQFNPDTVSGNQCVFSSINAGGMSTDFVSLMLVGSELRFIVSDGSSTYKKSGGTLTTGTWYDAVVSFNTSDNTIKLWLDGAELTGTNGTASSGMAMAENCDIGRDFLGPSGLAIHFNGQVRRLEIVTSAVASVSAFNSATKSKIYPIGEKSGTTSYSTVATSDPDITWTNSPGWTTQNDYFWNQVYGATLDSSVYVPALLSKASDAAGNTIGLPAGNYLNNTTETVNLAPVANTQWIKYAATVATFDGADKTRSIELPDDIVDVTEDLEVHVTFNTDTVSSHDAQLLSFTYGTSNRFAIEHQDNSLRCNVHDGDDHGLSHTIAASTEYTIKVVWDADAGEFTAASTVNGSAWSGTTAASVDSSNGSRIGAHTDAGSYGSYANIDGTLRDVKVYVAGVLKVDIPLALNPLDYSTSVNNGVSKDVVFSSHAGTKTYGTVVTPQSVDAATSNQEKEMILFTIGTE